MNRNFTNVLLAAGIAVSLFSCKKDDTAPVALTPASDGKTQTLNGGNGGSSAANAVFVDFSTDAQDSVVRTAWDLGFSSGSSNRVILNNTTAALAKVLTKNDLTQVGAADTTGMVLALNQFNPSPSEFALLDSYTGNLTQTVIPAISATDADNKVIIVNRGTGGVASARPWYKIRILRSATGYTLQYARITETTFKTLNITKDEAYNFTFASFDNGIVTNEPKKANWDIEWTYGSYKTVYNGVDVPYNFSDLVWINFLGGVTAAEVLTSTVTYDNYSVSNVATTTFSADKWVIGSNWRNTTGTVGVKTDRFYVIKDAAGNVYKLKFISFHSADGGERGKPVIEYKLVK